MVRGGVEVRDDPFGPPVAGHGEAAGTQCRKRRQVIDHGTGLLRQVLVEP